MGTHLEKSVTSTNLIRAINAAINQCCTVCGSTTPIVTPGFRNEKTSNVRRGMGWDGPGETA